MCLHMSACQRPFTCLRYLITIFFSLQDAWEHHRCAKCLMAQARKSPSRSSLAHGRAGSAIPMFAFQGCDVLAKNDRGHTPFALCTDPDVRLANTLQCLLGLLD